MTSRSDRLLWVAAFAGPTAWFCDLLLSFIVDTDRDLPTRAAWQTGVSLGALTVTVACCVIALLELRRLRRFHGHEPDPHDHHPLRGHPGEEPHSSFRKFLAVSTLILSVFSVLLVLGNVVPKLFFQA